MKKDHRLLFDKSIQFGHGKLLGFDIFPYKENLNIHVRIYKELASPSTTETNMGFCHAHLPDDDTNPQSAAQALLHETSKLW
jgi:hypothetical protein